MGHHGRHTPNSRFKTTNGVQVKSQPHCETCTGVSLCQLCDQERYFAERSRIVTGASAVPSRHSPSQSIELSAVSPARGESIDGSDRYWGEQASLDRGNQSLYASRSPLYGLSSSPQSNPDQWFSSPLMGSARSHCERWVCVRPSVRLMHLTLMHTAVGNTHTPLPYFSSATIVFAATTLLTIPRIHRTHCVIACSTTCCRHLIHTK